MSAVCVSKDKKRAILKDTLLKATDGQVAMMMPMVDPYMTAQLTCGIAADQRALNFSGYLAAGVIALITGAVAAFMSELPVAIGMIAGLVGIGVLVSLLLALLSARPIEFEYPGYNPGSFQSDILKSKSLSVMRREYLYCSQIAIEDNQERLEKAGNLMLWAMRILFLSLAGGAAGLSICAMLGMFGAK